MMMTLDDYARLCEFQHAVQPEQVAQALTRHYAALRQQSPKIHCCQSIAAARDAMAAMAAWASRASRAAWDDWVARAAWDDRDAWAARAARASRAARAVWDAIAVKAAWDDWSDWDASYYSMIHGDVWTPIYDAFRAGCWLYWLGDNDCWWVPIPTVHIEAGIIPARCHRPDGPALSLPDEDWYFLHGVLVDKLLVLTPGDQLDVHRWVVKESNAEIRREAVRKIGIERVCASLNATTMDHGVDHAGQPCELLALDIGDGRKRPYLKMRNPSIGVYHIEGRPPDCTTVAEALRFQQPHEMQRIPVAETGADWYQQGDVFVWPKGATALKPTPKQLT